MKTPSIQVLSSLVKHVKANIADDYRAFEDDDIPGIQLTVGWNPETGEWSYQTGDNMYSGDAYFYPIWAVCGVYRRSNSVELARDLIAQLEDQS